MLPDRVSNPGPLTYESDALPIALRGPACMLERSAKLILAYWPFFVFKCSPLFNISFLIATSGLH